MFSRKKLMILMVTAIILLLSACSTNNEEKFEEVDNAFNNNEEVQEEVQEEVPLSEALEKEKLWFEAKTNDAGKLEKETFIFNVYVFGNGEFTQYSTGELSVGDILDLSDDEIIELAIKRHNIEVEAWPSNEKYTDQAYDLGFLWDNDGYEIRGMQIYQDDGMDRSYSMGDNLVLTLSGGIFEESIEGLYFEGFNKSRENVFITRVDEKARGLFKYDDSDADEESVKFRR